MDNYAISIKGCVFTNSWQHKVFTTATNGQQIINFDNLTPAEISAFSSLETAMSKLNGKIPTDTWMCPIDFSDNVAIIDKNFGQNLPGIIISATYPDGTGKQYVLKNDLGGGKSWSSGELYEYVLALYENRSGTKCGSKWPFSLIVPDAVDDLFCKIPAYLWAAATLYAGYKAYEQKRNAPLAIAWGAGALFGVQKFVQKGGFRTINFKRK
jgi:hypothetical protein